MPLRQYETRFARLLINRCRPKSHELTDQVVIEELISVFSSRRLLAPLRRTVGHFFCGSGFNKEQTNTVICSCSQIRKLCVIFVRYRSSAITPAGISSICVGLPDAALFLGVAPPLVVLVERHLLSWVLPHRSVDGCLTTIARSVSDADRDHR